MNKKLFTLAAALMMGSAFTVNAQSPASTSALTGGEVIDGNTYYFLMGTDGVKDVYLTGTKVTTSAGNEYTAFDAVGAYTAGVVGNANALWKVVPSVDNGVSYVTLVNKGSGKTVAFKKDGSIVANGGAEPDITKLAIETPWGKDANNNLTLPASLQIRVNGLAESTGKYLNFDTEASPTPANKWIWTDTKGNAEQIKLVPVDKSANLDTEKLNALLGNGFTFNFPSADPAPAENVFSQKLVAVEIPSLDPAGMDVYDSGSLNGIYFVVSAPDGGIVKDAAGKKYYFADQTSFENSTVVALDPVANYGINNLNGDDKKFTTIEAGKLVTTAAAGKTHVDNARFTVNERDVVNAKGAYNITLHPYIAANATTDPQRKTNWKVVAITSSGTTYVTADGGTSAPNKVYDVKVSGSNVLTAADLLKTDGPAVFNIQFASGYDKLSKAGSSEYGKYLRVSTANLSSAQLLAEGPAYVNLDAPESQWIVTDYADGIYKFTDREGHQTIAVELRKTNTADVYDAHITNSTPFTYAYVDEDGKRQTGTGDFNTGEIKVKLVPATMSLNGGFADFTKEEMENPIQIKFTMNTGLFSKEMYMTADTKTKKVGLTADEDEAALWDIVKFAAKKDSISSKVSYAYLKNKQVAKSDAVANIGITTYALKLNGEDFYFDGKNNMVSTKKVAEAPRQIIKVLKDGSLYIFGSNTATSNTFGGNVGFGNQALSVSTSAELADNLISIYDNHQTTSVMEFESVKLLSESLEAQPRHASFQSIYGGIMGMDENNDAIIAATKDEAQALTFWLDTTDVKELSTRFYISQAVASEPEAETKAAAVEPRMFLFNAADSTSYYDEGTASIINNPNYQLSNGATKAIFKAGTLINKDSINTIVKGKEVGLNKDNGLNRFKFQILEVDDEQYVIKADDGSFLSSYNGKLGFGGQNDALIVTLGAGDATANEAIAAEAGVQVIGGQGVVTVQGAAGKVITVANILGQTIANQVAVSDNVTIAVPAGIAVVSVDGDATKVVVK